MFVLVFIQVRNIIGEYSLEWNSVKDTFFKVWKHLRIKAVGDLYKYIHALIKEWESHLSLYLEYCMFVSITNMFTFLLVSIKELVFSGPAWAAKIEFEWQTCCWL